MSALAAAILVSVGAALAPVELRSGAVVDAPIERLWAGGVEVGGAAPRTIGWQDVRRVSGARGEDAAAFADVADAAWRARIRLARGDTVLAQPLFEDLFRRLRDVDGPTPALAAEGLLRCKLRRGAHASAVDPWLEALRLRRAGWVGLEREAFAGLIDDDTGLAPDLCPIWLDGPALRALAADPPSAPTDDPVVAELAAWFIHAARLQAGLPTVRPPRDVVDDQAVRLVANIAEALDDNGATRLDARAWLRGELDRADSSWREAWIRAALGRSLLLEQDPDLRDRGLIELLHLPARFADEQPYLAGLALAVAAIELDRRGRADDAESLLADLRASSLRHPALRWVQRVRSGAATDRTAPDQRTDNDA